MKRYLIIGAGAIGASLAAQFELNGIPYRLFGRGEQIRHIQAHGIRYVRPEGTRSIRLQACADRSELALTQHDRLIFTTKTQDLERACADWAWLPVQGDGPARTASGLPVLTPQNGMAAERIALRWFSQVYGVSVNTPARYTELGQIVVGGDPEPGLMVVGRFPQGEDTLATEIAADLCQAGYLAEAQPDILRWKAAKLINSVRNNALDLFEGPPGCCRPMPQSWRRRRWRCSAPWALRRRARRSAASGCRTGALRLAAASSRASSQPGRASRAAPRTRSIS